ncbi:MAG: flagellar brake protein [Colwellia sp.]|nr:flagellar brake protein [Colwellia sp.]
MSELNAREKTQIFELQPGKSMDLQINHPVPLRLKLQLVGYDIGKYILLKYPRVTSTSEYKDVLVEGNVMIVRYLMEGNKGECFAFRSTIKHITIYPEKFLFLEYPKKIENRQLRTQQRTSIHIPAVIMIEEDENNKEMRINGAISDISLKGCGFSFKSKSSSTNVNKRKVFICLQSPAGVDMKISSEVCNSRNKQGVVNVGIKFLEVDEHLPELLEQLFINTNDS